MSDKNLAIRSVAFNWIGRGCSLVITFFVTPIVIAGLGGRLYGIWSMIMSVGSYYALGDLGMQSGIVKYVSEHHAKGEMLTLRKTISTALFVYMGLAAIVMAVSAPVAWLFPILLNKAVTAGKVDAELMEAALSPEHIAAIRFALVMVAVSISTRMIGQPFSAIFRGLNRTDVSNCLSVCIQISSAIALVVAVRTGWGLYGMAVVTAVTPIVGRTISGFLALRLIGGTKMTREYFDRDALKKLGKFTFFTVIREFMRKITDYTAPFIIGFILDPLMVAYYSIGDALVRKTGVMTRAVTSVAMPVASGLQAKKQDKDLKQVLVYVPRLVLAISFCLAAVLIIQGHRIVDLWIDLEGYADEVYPVLVILALAMALAKMGGGHRAILTGMGKIKAVTVIQIVQAFTSITLSFVLVWTMGLIGIAYARFFSRGFFGGVVLPVYACRQFKYPYLSYLKDLSIAPILAAVPVVAGSLAFEKLLPTESVYVLLCQIAGLGLMGGVSTFFLCFDATLRRRILKAFGFKKKVAMDSQ